MALTKISPALFQVSNNITSVTVGGSANTVSLTFDSNGVITGASNNALSVANTQITGLIEAAQIGSANATLVTSGTLPAARLPAGSVLQVVNFQTGAVATGTTTIPMDNTIPQNTEGNEYMTLAITPKSATSNLYILVSAVISNSALNEQTSALFVDTTANALAAITERIDAGSGVYTVSLTYYVAAASTSSRTYKFRSGGAAAGTTTFNGQVGVRLFGGVASSSITITEIAG